MERRVMSHPVTIGFALVARDCWSDEQRVRSLCTCVQNTPTLDQIFVFGQWWSYFCLKIPLHNIPKWGSGVLMTNGPLVEAAALVHYWICRHLFSFSVMYVFNIKLSNSSLHAKKKCRRNVCAEVLSIAALRFHRDLKPENILLCKPAENNLLWHFGSVAAVAPRSGPQRHIEHPRVPMQ